MTIQELKDITDPKIYNSTQEILDLNKYGLFQCKGEGVFTEFFGVPVRIPTLSIEESVKDNIRPPFFVWLYKRNKNDDTLHIISKLIDEIEKL